MTPTGIEKIDAVIRALDDGDVEALMALLEYQEIECVWPPPDGLGPVPLCEDGEPPGTVAAFFPVARCVGSLSRDPRVLLDAVTMTPGAITVRELPAASPDAAGRPAAQYAIEVGAAPQRRAAATLWLANGHIISAALGC